MRSAPKIALAPLDERPVNTRYPRMLAEIAGARVLLPPAEIRGTGRTPADRDAVAAWLRETTDDVDVVASIEFLLYGNLIGSRISEDSAVDVAGRLRTLEEIAGPRRSVDAFSLITRVSNADDAVEEPTYWATFGRRFYRYSALLHRRDAGALADGESESLTTLEADIPADLRADWLRRRLRNHTLNLALLDLVAREKIDFLLLTSDDTSPWGTPSREKAWLEGWTAMLGGETAGRVMLHPGADEVGSALIARRIVARTMPEAPRVFPIYAVPGDEALIAPYEDRAVRLTVEGQIRACGGVLAVGPEAADIILGVLTPSRGRREFRDDFADADRAVRTPYYRDLLTVLGAFQRAGRCVAIGDVAYPNGADPLAIEMLLDPACPVDPVRLAAYGAWNTAGNTLGVVVAQAVCSLRIGETPERQAAQRRFLAHRFLEDWGYQAVVRRKARESCAAQFGTRDPDPTVDDQVSTVETAIEAELAKVLATLQARGIGAGLQIRPGSTRLPWRRTFEVDFDLADVA